MKAFKREKIDPRNLDLEEKTVYIGRVSKVVKGGKRFNFSAYVVVGDRAGHIGFGHGKAHEVPDAVRKAGEGARKSLFAIPLDKFTIPHSVYGKFSASKVLLRPAREGSGIIACNAVRSVLELAGIKDILTKSLGSNTAHNLVKATIKALLLLKSPKEYANTRDKTVDEILNYRRRKRVEQKTED